MKGDFTRFAPQPPNGYSRVLLQQGRVLLDDDWNQQCAIGLARERATARDIVGQAAGPIGATGFTVSVTNGGDGLRLSAGRYYVDGILCELETSTLVSSQPALPHDPTARLRPGRYAVCLVVWERHVTFIEDPDIKEKALRGPDHTTRAQVVAQVELRRIPEGLADECAVLDEPRALARWIDGNRGRAAVSVDPTPADVDPCLVPPDAGYRGLENQLYRIEIHRGGAGDPSDPDGPTFKWSRDNGCSVATWLSGPVAAEPELHIEVSDLGDGERGFYVGPDRIVELLDDSHDLAAKPGVLAQIVHADEASRTLTLGEPVDEQGNPTAVVRGVDALHPRVRRWEGLRRINEVDVTDGGVGWIELESGIRVRFELGAAERFRTGDYWVVPARTVDGSIQWSPDALQKPHGIEKHYACLAVVSRDEQGAFTLERNHQRQFPPAAELSRLSYVGGDGQSGVLGQPLPTPLQVQVLSGDVPLAGARVRFELLDTAPADGSVLDPSGNSGTRLDVEAGADGVAQVTWTLASEAARTPQAPLVNQRLSATLLGHCDEPTAQTIAFSAHEAQASEVRYAPACEHMTKAGIDTVQAALDALCLARTLHYVVGTGQAVSYGQTLPVPLTVRVGNQGHASAGALVRFAIVDLTGAREVDEATGGTLAPFPAGQAPAAIKHWGDDQTRGIRGLTVKSDANGLARVTWRYGNLPGLGVPGVEAVLLALSGEPTLSLMRFGAAVQPCPVITALSWRHNVKEQKLAVVELLNGISRSALVFQFSEDVRFIDEGEVAREDGAHLA
ncbi:MAG TPA: DUF6519 domain-containing protein, partial [Polyangiaceae bacterium]|nr:DUF6519 domain-containing protein [Polyangiaceae bacterium]